jgi:hypothetical protein
MAVVSDTSGRIANFMGGNGLQALVMIVVIAVLTAIGTILGTFLTGITLLSKIFPKKDELSEIIEVEGKKSFVQKDDLRDQTVRIAGDIFLKKDDLFDEVKLAAEHDFVTLHDLDQRLIGLRTDFNTRIDRIESEVKLGLREMSSAVTKSVEALTEFKLELYKSGKLTKTDAVPRS